MTRPGIQALADKVRRGDHAAASRALTLVIDEAPEAAQLSSIFFRASGSVQKVGVCGPPGAGKSTLSGRLIARFRARKLRVAVLAVDPSSHVTGGAFLGDRLRIQEHALDPGVFIRSLATRGMVGGLSYTIFGAVHVLEAAGFGRIIIETVGTGQDEVEIGRVADSVVYVTTPQLGDEIQAMKAGVMEVGDFFVVNKADLGGRDKAVADLRSALSLGAAGPQRTSSGGPAPAAAAAGKPRGWEPPVIAASATLGEGIAELAEALDKHWKFLGEGEGRRRLKAQHREEVSLFLSRRLYQSAVDSLSDRSLDDLLEHKTDPGTLGRELLAKLTGRR